MAVGSIEIIISSRMVNLPRVSNEKNRYAIFLLKHLDARLKFQFHKITIVYHKVTGFSKKLELMYLIVLVLLNLVFVNTPKIIPQNLVLFCLIQKPLFDPALYIRIIIRFRGSTHRVPCLIVFRVRPIIEVSAKEIRGIFNIKHSRPVQFNVCFKL